MGNQCCAPFGRYRRHRDDGTRTERSLHGGGGVGVRGWGWYI